MTGRPSDNGAPAGLASYLVGEPMDPSAVPAEPLPATHGIPFAYEGSSGVILGATGIGRSTLAEALIYDAARAGLRCAYLGSEIGLEEFDARAGDLAERRGDTIDDELREQLARARYLDLSAVIVQAWADPQAWTDGMTNAYDVVVVDPLAAVASALGVDFDSNTEYDAFHDRLVQPLAAHGLVVLALDNIGHSAEARHRAKGASAKHDRADITCVCALSSNPVGLVVRVSKVRSVRAPFTRGDEWIFLRDTHELEPRTATGDTAVASSEFRPTTIMERASKLIEDTPGIGVNATRAAIKSKNAHVDTALRILIAEGYVDVRASGQTSGHHSLRPYRQLDDDGPPRPNRVPDTFTPSDTPTASRKNARATRASTASQPRPNRVPDTAATTASTASSLLKRGAGRDAVSDDGVATTTAETGPLPFGAPLNDYAADGDDAAWSGWSDDDLEALAELDRLAEKFPDLGGTQA